MVVEINIQPSPLFIRTVLLQEKAFGSVLELQVSDTGLISGKYLVPRANNPNVKTGRKLSHLSGRLVQADGEWGISGCWQYSCEHSVLDANECGEFNMICKQEGFEGWFTRGTECVSKRPWSWAAPGAAGRSLLSEVSAFVAPTIDQEKNKTSTIWLAQFQLLTAWFFVFMTAAALLLAIRAREAVPASPTGIALNFSFNILYTLIYGSFITISASLTQRFSTFHTLGVLLYTGGYAFFVILFSLAMFPGTTESQLRGESRDLLFGFSPCRFFYFLGSSAFLLGSGCLIHDNRPQNVQSASSIFMGSLLFLAGSLFFLADSTEPMWDESQSIRSNDLVSEDLACLGYILFFAGRLAFLHSSIMDLHRL